MTHPVFKSAPPDDDLELCSWNQGLDGLSQRSSSSSSSGLEVKKVTFCPYADTGTSGRVVVGTGRRPDGRVRGWYTPAAA